MMSVSLVMKLFLALICASSMAYADNEVAILTPETEKGQSLFDVATHVKDTVKGDEQDLNLDFLPSMTDEEQKIIAIEDELAQARWEKRYKVLEIESLTIIEKDADWKHWLLRRDQRTKYHIDIALGNELSEHVNIGSAPPKSSISERVKIITCLDDEADVDEDLTCTLYRKAFGPDRKVATAFFKTSDLLKPKKKTFHVGTKFLDNNGKATRGKLVLKLRRTTWNQVYKSVNEKQTKDIASFYKIAVSLLSSEQATTHLPQTNQIPRPSKAADEKLKMIELLNGALTFPSKPEYEPVPRGFRGGISLLNKLPFYDRQTNYKNREHAIREVAKLKMIGPPIEGRWDTPNSDVAMTRCFFASLGQWTLYKDESSGGYVSDTTHLYKYKHRVAPNKNRPYHRYGCKTYFDENGKVLRVVDEYGIQYFPDGTYIETNGEKKMNPRYWEWAKLLARTSIFVATAIEHLTQVHYTWGNYPGTGLRMYLAPDHPIRQAFSVHFYRTPNTNIRAQHILFAESGLLSRSTSWHYRNGLERFYEDLLTQFEFQEFPEMLKERGVDKCEFLVGAKDGVESHEIFTKYAAGYIDMVYEGSEEKLQRDDAFRKCHAYVVKKLNPTGKPFKYEEYNLENVKKVWGEILFRVTGYHAAIGQVTAFAADPTFVNLRIQTKETEDLVATQESALAIAGIGGVTMVACPTIDQDWKQVFDEVPECYKVLRKELNQLKRRIDKRNKHRFPNNDFHPAYCPVSITA